VIRCVCGGILEVLSLMEKFENLRKDILNLLEKEVEKLKGDLNV